MHASIHLRDMVTLKEKHPQLAQQFESGKFVVHKSSRQFSGMAIDQAHEQANAVIKGDGELLAWQRIQQPWEDGW